MQHVPWAGVVTSYVTATGDQTGHLLWRIQNGETPDSDHQPAAAVILIGTNDLGVAVRPVKRGGLGVTDPTPCAVGTAVRWLTCLDPVSSHAHHVWDSLRTSWGLLTQPWP